MRRWEANQDRCPEHGGPRSDCEDPDKQWFSQRTVCHVAMKQAAIEWAYDRFREKEPFHDGTFRRWSAVRSLTHPYHYRDGVRLWLAPEDLSPHDHFLESADECEVCNPPEDP